MNQLEATSWSLWLLGFFAILVITLATAMTSIVYTDIQENRRDMIEIKLQLATMQGQISVVAGKQDHELNVLEKLFKQP